jgi:hypothetical protein
VLRTRPKRRLLPLPRTFSAQGIASYRREVKRRLIPLLVLLTVVPPATAFLTWLPPWIGYAIGSFWPEWQGTSATVPSPAFTSTATDGRCDAAGGVGYDGWMRSKYLSRPRDDASPICEWTDYSVVRGPEGPPCHQPATRRMYSEALHFGFLLCDRHASEAIARD